MLRTAHRSTFVSPRNFVATPCQMHIRDKNVASLGRVPSICSVFIFSSCRKVTWKSQMLSRLTRASGPDRDSDIDPQEIIPPFLEHKASRIDPAWKSQPLRRTLSRKANQPKSVSSCMIPATIGQTLNVARLLKQLNNGRPSSQHTSLIQSTRTFRHSM